MATPKPATRRNTRSINFSDEEHAEITKKARKAGLYLRQYIMLLVRGAE